MPDPLVTVVTPSYDRPDAIHRAIDTVFQQTYRPIEHIIIDDHSPTPVSDALNERWDQICVYRHEINKGANAARNTGINLAEGKYIAFLDDDDEWDESKIEQQVSCAKETGAGIVYTGVKQVSNGSVFATHRSSAEGKVTREMVINNPVPTFSAVLVCADLFDKVGVLDDQLPNWQDWEFYIRASLETEFAAIPEPLVVRHHHKYGQISSDYDAKCDISAKIIRDKYGQLVKDLGVEDEFTARIECALGATAIEAEQYGAARKHYLRAAQTNPTAQTLFRLVALAGGHHTYRPIIMAKRSIITTSEEECYISTAF